MTISRRRFVSAGVLAAAATLSVPGVFAQTFKERDGNPGEVPPVQTDPLANYSKASFVSYLNSIFQIQTAQGVVEVSLARVGDMPAPKGGECFSLLFRGGRAALKQDTYVVVHPALGTFQLFLVAGGSDQNGAREYVATINRLSLADFANSVPPSRNSAGSQRSSSPTSSSTPGPGSTSPATSTSTSTPAVVTSPATTQTTTSLASTPVASPTRHRKRKPSRKRVDSKTPFIN